MPPAGLEPATQVRSHTRYRLRHEGNKLTSFLINI